LDDRSGANLPARATLDRQFAERLRRDRFQVLIQVIRLRRLCCHFELVAPGAANCALEAR